MLPLITCFNESVFLKHYPEVHLYITLCSVTLHLLRYVQYITSCEVYYFMCSILLYVQYNLYVQCITLCSILLYVQYITSCAVYSFMCSVLLYVQYIWLWLWLLLNVQYITLCAVYYFVCSISLYVQRHCYIPSTVKKLITDFKRQI